MLFRALGQATIIQAIIWAALIFVKPFTKVHANALGLERCRKWNKYPAGTLCDLAIIFSALKAFSKNDVVSIVLTDIRVAPCQCFKSLNYTD